MERKIKFRAKTVAERSRWAYGSLITYADGSADIYGMDAVRDGSKSELLVHVDISTVGQFTGLKDRCGKEVYEGDIVKMDGADEKPRVVVYYEESFNIATAEEYDHLLRGSHPYLNDYAHMTCLNEWSNTGLVRVVGNIHENPELLKQ